MILEIILSSYLIALAATAIFADSYYFRQVVKLPFLLVYLVVRFLLTLISFGKVKMPQVKRKASKRFRDSQLKSLSRRGQNEIREDAGWTSARED